jgi:hypothetical protein
LQYYIIGKEVSIMTQQEFIKLEARALSIVNNKDCMMVWKAVECGALDTLRDFAEARNYDVSLNELVDVLWFTICSRDKTLEERDIPIAS